jgi:hypothetical protein
VSTLNFTMPHLPQGDQKHYYHLPTRFTIGCIGRQYGKTTLALRRHVKRVLHKPGVYWWIAPITDQAKIAFKRTIQFYKPLIREVNKTDREVRWWSGSTTYFKGSDDYENLKGESLSGATLDECGTMHAEVWPEVIRPMLATTKGWADFIGTPKGKNHFYQLWLNAGQDPDWSRHHASSEKSPFFPESELLAAKASTPEAIFRQEYLAEFIEHGGEVFKDFKECIKGELEPPNSNAFYVMGVDLARLNDWTVITVWDVQRKHLVYFERFNQVNWSLQEDRIMNVANKYNKAHIIPDGTGVGDPVVERLRQKGGNVFPVKITAPVKEHLIESLVMAIEKREITFPHIPEIVTELSVFAATKTPTGNFKYSAPSGMHDDCVMSMALAVTKFRSARAVPVTLF